MSQNSTGPRPRRIWRMSASAPLGEIVEVEAPKSGARPNEPQLDIDEWWPEADWQSSSFDLLNGCEVKDYTGRLPDRVFNALFRDE